jgi:hypothetical protein
MYFGQMGTLLFARLLNYAHLMHSKRELFQSRYWVDLSIDDKTVGLLLFFQSLEDQQINSASFWMDQKSCPEKEDHKE